MTSLPRLNLGFYRPHSISISYRQIANMSRSISPPPSKRQKISAIPTPTQASDRLGPLPPLGTNSLRIFSWNINGITPFLQAPITSFFQPSKSPDQTKDATPPASLRHFLHRHSWPSILFLQEVKISPKDTKTQDAVRTAINAHLPSESETKGPLYDAQFILPTDPHNARGPGGGRKVYGVCSIFRRDLYSQYEINTRTVAWDNEGRVSVLELTHAGTKTKLALFNIYAVNGTGNAYRDPHTGVVKGTRHARKLAFHRLLARECRDLEERGWHVVLGGDMNVALAKPDGFPKLRVFPEQHVRNRVNFHERFLQKGEKEGCWDGVDVWRGLHGEERRYTYFPRGRTWGSSCDRVDYFIVGRKSVEGGLVEACGIMDSEAERGTSDHVPIWMDVQLKDDHV